MRIENMAMRAFDDELGTKGRKFKEDIRKIARKYDINELFAVKYVLDCMVAATNAEVYELHVFGKDEEYNDIKKGLEVYYDDRD